MSINIILLKKVKMDVPAFDGIYNFQYFLLVSGYRQPFLLLHNV